MRLTANKIAGILRQNGYKLTPQRHAVLRVIAGSSDHLTTMELYDRVHQECPGIGRVTVYRLLDILTELDLVCEVRGERMYRSYLMRRPTEHHHHLICSNCSRVIDFTDCDLSEMEKRLSQDTKFKINGHLLEFVGQCRKCIKETVSR